MPMLFKDIHAASGVGAAAGRRPTVVSAPDAASAEFSARPRRRTFTAADKLRILADIDRAAPSGGIGAVLRREGLYSSTLCDWRRLRDAGAFGAPTPVKRGPKTAQAHPLTAEVALLQKDKARLLQRLTRAEAIIEIQKKVAALLGIPLAPGDDAP
jgi:transposase